MREIMLNLSAWIERRADNLKPYADHIIHSVKAYEAEIERLRRPEAAQVRVKPEELEFNEPFSLTHTQVLGDDVFWLKHHGKSVASFSVSNFGSEQACIEAAWRVAYLSDDERSEDERNKELVQAYTTGASDMRRRAAASVREWQAFTKYAQERISDEMADEIMALDITPLTDDSEPDTVTDQLSKSIAEFVSRQEPLGAEFEQVLADNIEELYEAQPDTAADTVTGWQDISTAPKLSVDDIVSIIEKTEVSDMTQDGDKRWVNRMAEALYHKLNALPPAPEKEG